jgi:hypothetical protein
MSSKEQSIQRALNELGAGLFSPLREYTQYYRVPNSTAAHRRAGRPSVPNPTGDPKDFLKKKKRSLFSISEISRGRIYAPIPLNTQNHH